MPFARRHPLSRLFEPEIVALVGASDNVLSAGGAVLRQMRGGPFRGTLLPVNPRHATVAGLKSYPRLADLPVQPDLVVIATRADTLPDIVTEAASIGAGAAAILTAGLGTDRADNNRILARICATAQKSGLRLLGPNSLGIARPSSGLNATFGLAPVARGSVALLSQSGGLTSAVLDRAATDGVGFSSVVSLGNQLDVGFAEALDFLTLDPETESIVMYVEGVKHARRFTSALRAAARIKPVVVLKSGRGPAGSKAATTHTGALAGPDEAFDAVLRRCGAVRVAGFLQLFAAAKYLSSRYRPVGRRLAVITNGGGPGVMAVDRASDMGLTVGPLSPGTIAELDRKLPPHWSRDNPVDLMEDARPDLYRHAIGACLEDPGVDGLLAIVTPQAMSDPAAVAGIVKEAAERAAKPVIACFMGELSVREPLRALHAERLPTFQSPEPAVEAFAAIAGFYENQRLLMQVPGPLSLQEKSPDVEGATMIIDNAIGQGRTVLSESETKAVLAAFHVSVAPVAIATDAVAAITAAQQFGFPVALKVNSPDITHKSDVGGVWLNLQDGRQVREAFQRIVEDVQLAQPGARIEGVAVEPMAVKRHGRELMIGVSTDSVFGPVIAFGAGGREVEIVADRSVALPPLNGMLAHALIARTRVAGSLDAWRGWPAASMSAIEETLLRVSELVCEIPAIESLDINPLIADETGAVVADARMVVKSSAPRSRGRYEHMAICPYPTHLTREWSWPDGRSVTVRAIRPEDAEMEQAFVRGLSEESRYFRFVNAMNELSERMLVRFTQIDYDRELALIAVVHDGVPDEQIAVARYVMTPEEHTCEFAIAVADGWHGKGIGRRLMSALMEAARDRGLEVMVGFVMSHNTRMLHLMSDLGFEVGPDPDDPSMRRVRRDLTTWRGLAKPA
ncbi:MAG: bifunctional acetate--CoA ligase family protein/GNAT family N-acetyltransferase [Betaproteobacteria bacterium]|nr:bifunctional acetate--CoA ligase family protein/GNAT family N-acetyltransferase [Betaproteobacteria bacterium]